MDSNVGISLYSFGSTQINLPSPLKEKVLSFVSSLPEEAITDGGREETPHITVLYGLHLDHPQRDEGKLLALGKTVTPFRVRLGKCSIFPSMETHQDYEVLKIDVMSEGLRSLHRRIASLLPGTQTHPVYRPHVTLAYMKVGQALPFLARSDFEGITFLVESFLLSNRAGETREIPLLGERPSLLTKSRVTRPGSKGATVWHYDEKGEIVYGPYIPPKGHKIPTNPPGRDPDPSIYRRKALLPLHEEQRHQQTQESRKNTLETLDLVRQALPLLEKRTKKDLLSSKKEDHICALATRLLLHTGLSPSYFSSLRHAHLSKDTERGDVMMSLFRSQDIPLSHYLHDPDVSSHLLAREQSEGKSKKVFLLGNKQKHPLSVSQLDSYLSSLGVTVHALRIWAASERAALYLSSYHENPETEEENKMRIETVIKKVAHDIGEKTGERYICPALLASYALHHWPIHQKENNL